MASGMAHSKKAQSVKLNPLTPDIQNQALQIYSPQPAYMSERPINSPLRSQRGSTNQVTATLVSDLSLPYTRKVNHSMSKVEREVDKLNHILEIERNRAEQTRIKAQQIEEQAQRSQTLAEMHKRNRELQLKIKNAESFNRAKALDQQIQRERDIVIEQKQLKEAEALRRREKERYKLEQLRHQVSEQKEENFKQKIDNYQQELNQRMQKKSSELEHKNLSAEQLLEVKQRKKQQKLLQKAQQKQDLIYHTLARHQEMVERDVKSWEDKVHKTDMQAEAHRRRVEQQQEAIRLEAQRKQQEIDKTLELSNVNLRARVNSFTATINNKEQHADLHLRRLSEDAKKKIETDAEKKRFQTLNAQETAQKNELQLKQHADEVLRRKFSVAEKQIKHKKDNLEVTLEQRELKRQRQMQLIQEHNQEMERQRQLKLQKFEDKLARVELRQKSDQMAQEQISKIKFDIETQKQKIKAQISGIQAS